MRSEEPLLKAQGLTKHFALGLPWDRHKLHAVDDIDLEIHAGKIVALVGESGSGKSTVVRLLDMLYRPTGGEIYFEGRPLSAMRSRREQLDFRRKVRLVFQDPFSMSNPAYRVSHSLMRSAKLHRPDLRPSERRPEVERVLETVGLVPGREIVDRFPYELSGGQRQRVGFAEALLSRPRVILADEPVSMLDVSIRIGLLNLMADLRDEEGVSILYVTHDIASAWYLADSVAVMYAGKLVEQGSPDLVLRHPAHPYTQLLLSAVPDPRAPLSLTEAGTGEPPRVIDPGPGCRFVPRCPYAMERCSKATPELVALPTGQAAACYFSQEAGALPALPGGPESAPVTWRAEHGALSGVGERGPKAGGVVEPA
jgi:peptide/nickel transport system ATP-binding protein